MSSIDQRVVQMTFDNAQFERGVAQSMNSLSALNKQLQMQGATKGLQDVAAATQKTPANLDSMAKATENVASRFTRLGMVANGALLSIGAKAVETGKRLLSSLSLDPLTDGFREYETNMNSIQTIMANTGLEGDKGLKIVTTALDKLNHYADQTIYNFSEMAKNIGTFTAAGVDLDTATAAIKGIANLAAVSGTNAEKASVAMYQLSQAISSGKMSLEDWNSVETADMGGKIFRESLKETARLHGIKVDEMIKRQGSFRLSLQEGWLTSKVLTDTLAKFTGDMTAAQLKSAGYTAKQIKDILKLGKTAQDAATKVKTMTQLFATIKEGLGSGWAQTWQIIFGNFNEAKTMFTEAGIVLGKYVDASTQARNKLLTDWKKLGGRTELIKGISGAFQALVSVVKPIKDAFRDIFPATTAKQLYEATVRFREFTERLKISSDTAEKLRRVFKGVFTIFAFAGDIIKGIAGVFGEVFREATKGSGSILDFAARVGDFLVETRAAILEGKGLTNVFKGISDALKIPIKLARELAKWLGSLFKDADPGAATERIGEISKQLEPMGKLGDVVSKAWSKVITVVSNVWSGIRTMGGKISKFFNDLNEKITGFVAKIAGDLGFEDVIAGLNTGLFAGLVLLLRNFLGGGGGGILGDLRETLDGLNGTLGAMQNTLRATTLLQIAVAIGILAIAANQLAKVDPKKLLNAASAMTIMFGQLLGAMLVFEKLSGFTGFMKMPFVALSMILLATAVKVLADSVEKLSTLDWNGLAKGLTGTTALLAALVGVSKFVGNPAGLISTGLGMIVLAGAVKILVTAVKDLSDLEWEELAKGLVGVGTLLGSLALFTKFAAVGKGAMAQGAGIILLATGLKILATVVEDFAEMNWHEIGRGLAAMGGGLVLMAGALKLLPPNTLLSAAGIFVVAGSLSLMSLALKDMAEMQWDEIGRGLTVMAGGLVGIAAALKFLPPNTLMSAAGVLLVAGSLSLIALALKSMGEMSWEEIGKGLLVMAASLGIIAGAMFLMTAALPGAQALVVISAALLLLIPVMQAFSAMSLMEIGQGLLMLAGVFAVIGVAGLLLTPVVPALMGLGTAILLLGAGMMAAGVGIMAFAAALTMLAAVGAAGTAAIVGIVAGLLGLIPEVMKQIGLGLIAFAKVIKTAGPAITEAIVVVLLALMGAIEKTAPKIISTILNMLTRMLQALANYVPKMVDAGMKLLTGFLRGIANNIGKVINEATRVAVNFLNGIARNLPKIIDSGFKLIISFIQGLRKAIDANAATMGREGGKLAVALIKGMVKGIMAGAGEVIGVVKNLGSQALSGIKDVLGINSPSKEFERVGKWVVQGFRKGLDSNKKDIDSAFFTLKDALRALMKESGEDIDKLEQKLKKLQNARRRDIQAIKETKEALKQARLEKKQSTEAYNELTKNLNDERIALGKLANDYDKVTTKLQNAQQKLADSIKTRDDYNKAVKEQYSDMASATGDTKVADYIKNLEKQIEDTKVFSNALQRLRALGLNDEMYKDLLATGISALPFVQELLRGGRTKVNEINKLGRKLDEVGANLGKSASTALYEAAVQSAKGLVKGLQNEQKNIEKEMDKIADAMVKSIKKKLGIKSPSRVMMGVGEFTTEGLVIGLDAGTAAVEKSAATTGQAAVDAMKKSLTGFSDLITNDMVDAQPTITPVLDLSSVRREAGQIGGMFGRQTMNFDPAYSKAMQAHLGYMSNRTAASLNEEQSSTPFVYNQYNSSPKALSEAEIYRQTKNQLSMRKGV